jgi:hypothetical protein
VSERLSLSFADPDAGLHCYGTDELALALSKAAGPATATAGPIEHDGETGRFTVVVSGVCTAELEPLGPPAVSAGGERSDWLCRLSGTNAAGAELRGFGCVTAAPRELGDSALRRGLWVCFGPELGVTLTATRPRGRGGHGDEAIAAYLSAGTPLTPTPIADPRLSTTYAKDGHILRAGLELWPDDGNVEEDESESHEGRDRLRAMRIAGTTIATGQLGTTSVAFLAWRHNGQTGTGCYTIEHLT